MYRLLIVDDEYQIVDWIYGMFSGLPHLELDICRAYSGSEALEWLNKIKIDIIISDICMPGMDGLKLAEKVRKNWPFCKLIFLTGYAEFDYVYKAIKYENVSYILKTEEDETLIKAVEKAVQELDKSLMCLEVPEKAREQMHYAIPLMQKEFINDLLTECTFEPEITQERFDELAIPMSADEPIFVVLGSMDDIKGKVKTYSAYIELIYKIKVICDYYLPDFPRKLFTEYRKGTFTIFIQPEEDEKGCNHEILKADQMQEFLALANGRIETIQSACRESLGLTNSFITACNLIPWENVNEKVSYLKQLLDYCSGLGAEVLLSENKFPESVQNKTNRYISPIKNAISQLRKTNLLAEYLERGQKEEFYGLLAEILDCLKEVKSKNYGPALEIYFTISSCLLSYINKWRLTEKITFRIGLYQLTQIQDFEAWSDAVNYIYRLSDILFDLKKNDKASIQTDSITVIQQYIDNHLEEDLSLARLSEMVYFNPSYFSRLFKQATGKNLCEYIQDARIEKAKKLLIETDMKIQKIASTVGIESSSYFGYYFKKAIGMSPNEYRENFIKSKNYE